MKDECRKKYELSLDQRYFFGHNGYLQVTGLLTPDELQDLDTHSMDMALNKVDFSQLEDIEARNEGTTPTAMEDKYFRFMQFHKQLQIHERFILQQRILDVLEVLIGPDLMAMQSMLFLKPPGQSGQAFHQDSFYIKTRPDTLCGAWIAIDDCDAENGCMEFIPGSHLEPIYQDVGLPENDVDFNGRLTEIKDVDTRSQVLATAKAGDVVFFHGHLMHRSRQNRSKDRFRRAYVCHYANARSYTEWGGGNANHILVRGTTHLAYAKSKFINFAPELVDI